MGFIAEIFWLVFLFRVYWCDFIAMVAKIFWRDSWVRHILLGGCSRFGLVVDRLEREKNRETENKDEERREKREIFLYYFIL